MSKNFDNEMIPTKKINTQEIFNISCNFEVKALNRSEHVPEIDNVYKFDKETTLSILAGFAVIEEF